MSRAVRYHLAARALEEGRVAFARAELATLFEDPAIPAGLRLQVQYTLSIALMQSGQAGRAVELLEDMRASAPSHPGSIHLPDVLGELAAALLAVGRPADAYERAGEAIALVESDGKTNVIARINRGAAALTLRRFDDARNDLLAALQASIAGRDLARAGTAAENLARTELAAGQHGRSHVWAELARRAYQVARPQLLPRLASVLAAVDVAGVPPGESPRPREAE